MKQMKLLILLAALALSSVLASAGQITHTVTYDPSKLSITYDTICGVSYANVNYEGLFVAREAKDLSLPKHQLLFSVPFNATRITVTLDNVQDSLFSLNSKLNPFRPSLNNYSKPTIVALADTVIYNTNAYFPTEYYSVTGEGYIYGGNHVVSINLNPIRYNPIIDKLQLITNATLIIKYDISSSEIKSIYRGNDSIRALEQNELKLRVVNPESVVNNKRSFSKYYGEIPVYDNVLDSAYTYCVITKRHLAHAFRKIIGLKRQKGLTAGVVCLEDLLMDDRFNCGDWHDCNYYNCRYYIEDDAGVIREYLKYAHGATNTPTQYVLLGGDRDNCPIRIGGYIKDYLNQSGRSIPTDLYFSNLECDWDIDQDLNYGEFDKMKKRYGNLMFQPSVYVGRLLCKNEEEIENYTRKLVHYTLNCGRGDFSYITKGLISQAGQLQYWENSAAKISSKFTQYLSDFNLTILQENNGDIPTGAMVIDTLNSNFGYVGFHGHGSPVTTEVGSNEDETINYTLLAEDDAHAMYPVLATNYDSEYNLNSLNLLSNNGFPNVIYSTACSTMPFDVYEEDVSPYYVYNVPCNMGHAFTTKSKNGSVAYLGYTRPSFIGWAESTNYSSTDLEAFFLEDITKYHKIGMAECISKFDFSAGNMATSTGQMMFAHNLLGDPEVGMWTSIPQRYGDITVNRYDSYYMIDGITASDTIGYCDNEGKVGRVIGMNGLSYLYGMSPSTSIMVYNHDHIPYIAPMKLQNCDINNSQYLYASSFSAGKSILPNIANGNVTIKNGAVYEIEATDDVYLGEGFIVENGATFAIKTPGKVTIDGCVFQSGAKVKIESGSVKVIGKFTAELGSKVEMTQFTEE